MANEVCLAALQNVAKVNPSSGKQLVKISARVSHGNAARRE